MNTIKYKQKISTNSLVKLALFSSIIFILGMTPLGFIPFGLFKIVTIHIPVIIGSILLGPKKGAFLGSLFGLTSFIMSHLQPSLSSYFFSPIISGNFFSLIICFLPRILVGIVPYYLFKFFKKFININISLIITGILGSLINTVLVLFLIYNIFGEKYAEILNTSLDNLLNAIFITVGINAVLEAFTSAILTLSICKVLFKITK